MMKSLHLLVLVPCVAGLVACSRTEPELKKDPVTTPAGSAGAVTSGGAPVGPLVLARGVVKSERGKAKDDGRDLVVYVGATWCEPCKHFHKAAQSGALDADFPNLTLLEFDLDEDRDRLATAGYVSQFIPLFAMPAADGRASDKKFEGAVKGDGAVKVITPRLRSLLSR
jgi:thiol-disulfide isomerase/thioredoxin